MRSYIDFATIYDSLMHQDVDYGAMADYIEDIFKVLDIKPELVLDLGCGTGNLTSILWERGYDMIGIDLSNDMLNVARVKGVAGKADSSGQILYLCQDMREFELYGTVDAIVCMTDVMNYITQSDDILKVFRLAKNYLNPGGVLIFDINSAYKLESIIGNNTFTYDDEQVFYAWENEFDEDRRVCDFYLTFFVKDAQGYRRFDEEHTQRAYGPDEVVGLLNRAGFGDAMVYDAYTFELPHAESERLVFVAR